MLEIGKVYELTVIDQSRKGYILRSDLGMHIEMDRKDAVEKLNNGDKVRTFIYRNKQGELTGSTNIPPLLRGETASLTVVDLTARGAFLKWGLQEDLFWPKDDWKYPIQKGHSYVVALVTEEKRQLIATGNIYPHLQAAPHKQEGEIVAGRIYDFSDQWGAFVAVESKYFGLIPRAEIYTDLAYGDMIYARIVRVREDGKLDLALRKEIPEQMDEDAEFLLDELRSQGGFLSLTDKSSPEEIKTQLQMSKSAFKRALGRLLKRRVVIQTEKGIELLDYEED